MRLRTASFFAISLASLPAFAGPFTPEKEDLALGFIKLTKVAQAVAHEQGVFEDEGLFVRSEAQSH